MISKIKHWWEYISTPQTRIRCIERFDGDIKVYEKYYCEERTWLLDSSWKPIHIYGYSFNGEASTLKHAMELVDVYHRHLRVTRTEKETIMKYP